MVGQRLVLSLLTLGILGCWSLTRTTTNWEIHPQAEPATSSGFYILNDWQDSFTDDTSSTAPLPAAAVSNIMLKTLGILTEGSRWAGVQMGRLFSRPHATALFVVDGITQGAFGGLSSNKFSVDQTGLTGSTSVDMRTMFSGDNVAVHMSKLFDGRSQTRSISGDEQVALASSADGAYSGNSLFTDTVKMIRADSSVLVPYGLETDSMELGLDEDIALLAELLMIHQTMDQLKGLKSYANDGAPDIYIFTVSTIRALELKYGVGSNKVKVAAKLIEATIKKVSDELVSLYEGKILVQALVLEWTFPDETSSDQLQLAHDVLKPFLVHPDFKDFKSNLPQVHLTQEDEDDSFLCSNLKDILRASFKVVCPDVLWSEHRHVRGVPDDLRYRADVAGNVTLGNVSAGRSEGFAAIFLITLFLGLSLGLAIYAVSWMMWTMDPGRDSIIYRQVADPNEGMRM